MSVMQAHRNTVLLWCNTSFPQHCD